MTIRIFAPRLVRRVVFAGVTVLALAAVSPTPASAQWAVFDATNFSQNVLTAARELQQINNEVLSLQNEAQMLINQARNLTSLPYSALSQLSSTIQRTQQLLGQAQGIAYNVANIQSQFQSLYPTGYTGATSSGQLITSSQGAIGALQAQQAGNQLLALVSQQLADVTALLAAQGRAQSLQGAQVAAGQNQGRAQLQRFLTPGAGYQPTNITMFH